MAKMEDLLAYFKAKGITLRGSFYIDRTSSSWPIIRPVRNAQLERYDVFKLYREAANTKEKPYYQFLKLAEASEEDIVSFYNRFGAIGLIFLKSDEELVKEYKRIHKEAKDNIQDITDAYLSEYVDRPKGYSSVKTEARFMQILVDIATYLNEEKIKDVRRLLLENAEMIFEPFIKENVRLMRLLREFLPNEENLTLEDFMDVIEHCNEDDLRKFTEGLISILFERVLKNVTPSVKLLDKKIQATWDYLGLLAALYMQLWLDLQQKELHVRHCDYCGKLFPLSKRQTRLLRMKAYCHNGRCAKNAAQATHQSFKAFVESKGLDFKKLSEKKRKELKDEFLKERRPK